MKVMFPTGDFITPGTHVFEVEHVEVEETWWMGHLIETHEVKVLEDHELIVPCPGLEDPEDHPVDWPARGSFAFKDRTWTVVREDDVGFWGWKDSGEPHTKSSMLQDLDTRNQDAMTRGARDQWWDLDAQGAPVRAAIKISIQSMVDQHKTLMAHLLVDLGLFKSVSEAKRNGWDKALELGRHELGPRKKRITVELVP